MGEQPRATSDYSYVKSIKIQMKWVYHQKEL